MIKEFKINDILNAVNAISKSDKKNNEGQKIKKKLINEGFNLISSDSVKLNRTEVLVLDQMID
mgnify:CR=1 FL=1